MARSRRERVPLGRPRLKLDYEARPGYVRRVMNDADGRLEAAQAAGYSFVKDAKTVDGADDSDMGSMVRKSVGTSANGQPLYGYLMEIKQEWSDQDQAEKLKKVNDVENQIRQGEVPNQQEADSMYVPDTGIKISQEN
jgi:hypothetical protein